MKRELEDDQDPYALADVSLPSPQYTEHDSGEPPASPTKKHRTHRPTHDLTALIDDSLLEFITREGTTHKRFRPTGKPLVLVFFGVMQSHLHSIETLEVDAQIIGASVNVSTNEYSFPIINGTLLTKAFGVRDPVGGGVYPKDVLIFFDKHGKKRHEILIGYSGRLVTDKPVTEVIRDVLEEMEETEEMVL